jgi:pyruvate/2-oxoglutarate dehydrogenase complex dihydrolipoamide dehydrogenase (E3) component
MPQFDAIIIGTGQAGPSLAARLTGAGMQVAVVERGKFGGTCVNTGCTPTKTLVASAYAAHLASRTDLGIATGGVTIDMKRIKARKDYVSGVSSSGVENWLRANDRCKVYQGHARFSAPGEVEVNQERLRADRIFINVGGRASAPPIPGLEQVRYLTNSSILELDTVPSHLIVIGGSYIGLEFAQVFRRFGSQISVVELAPRLVAREDEDVSAAIADILTAEGIGIHLNTKCLSVEQGADGGISLTTDCSGSEDRLTGSHLLLAVGRRPNTDDLGLEHAGVLTDQRGYITVDDQLRTNVAGIWALGDCNGRGAFTHTAYNDFEIVSANLLDDDHRSVNDRIPAYNLYIDPPLGRVGMTEAEVRKTGRPALKADMPMERVGRAFEKGETKGFMRILVDQESKQILGASILGVSGDEVIHTILALMYAGAPYTVLRRAMHIHPTVSELLPTLVEQLTPI